MKEAVLIIKEEEWLRHQFSEVKMEECWILIKNHLQKVMEVENDTL